jgi:hypothetical protein
MRRDRMTIIRLAKPLYAAVLSYFLLVDNLSTAFLYTPAFLLLLFPRYFYSS